MSVEHRPRSPVANAPNPASVRMTREFPLLWKIAEQYDFAERLGGCIEPLWEEVDRALREIWDARQAATNDGEDAQTT